MGFLFFLSRFIFINNGPVFFDSPEYLSRLSQSNLKDALLFGHWPYHFGYIFLYWPIYQLSGLIKINPSISVIFFQILVAYLGVRWFYKFVKNLTDKEIALRSAVILSLLPLFWITNETIMIETTHLTFFIGSLSFFISYLLLNKRRDLIISLLIFGYSFFVNQTVVLWLPVFLYLTFVKKKKSFFKIAFFLALSIFIALLVEGFILSNFGKDNVFQALLLKYSSKNHEFSHIAFDFHMILVNVRNFIIPLLRNNTNLVVMMSALSLIILSKFKTKYLFIISLLFITPALLVNQWSDGLFYGREALITSFGLAFLCGFLSSSRKLFALIICYLLIVSLPALSLLKRPIPYIEEAKMVQTLPSDSLLLESHFARPQTQFVIKGKVIYIGEPGSDPDFKKTIDLYLSKNRPVFVSAQALSEPYGLYTGPYLHTLGLSYVKNPELQSLMTQFNLKEYKSISKEDNLVLYKIISKGKSSYPPVKKLYKSKRRIDFSDPFTKLWFVLPKSY